MTPAAPHLLPRARRLLLGCLIVFWVSAFVATHTPRDPVPGPPHFDKWLHSVGYFLLGSGLWMTLAAYGHSRGRRVLRDAYQWMG